MSTEVGAAEALVAERAGPAPGGNVGRFGAGAERDRNLANLLAERLGEG